MCMTSSPSRVRRTVRTLGAALVLALAATAGPVAAPPQGGTSLGVERIVPPAPPTDPSLLAFLAELGTIARKRDTAALLARLWKDVSVKFGSARGHEAFTRHYRLKDPASPFWRDLEWLLTVPGEQTRPDNYVAPYGVLHGGDGRYVGTHALVIRPRTTMRAAPASTAAAIVDLSYDLVLLDISVERPYDRADHEPYGPPWTKVQLADGRRGYVHSRDIWPTAGFRIGLSRDKDGRWQIDEYTAGD